MRVKVIVYYTHEWFRHTHHELQHCTAQPIAHREIKSQGLRVWFTVSNVLSFKGSIIVQLHYIYSRMQVKNVNGRLDGCIQFRVNRKVK